LLVNERTKASYNHWEGLALNFKRYFDAL